MSKNKKMLKSKTGGVQNTLEPAPQKVYKPTEILKANIPLFFMILVLVFVLYGNVINGTFLTADDIPGIVNNPMTTDLVGSLKTLNSDRIVPAVLYAIFGMQSWPFHILALIFHTLNSILVFVFIFILFDKKKALITTLLFVIHPINTEAVSWISGFPYLLLTTIYLACLILYVLAQKTGEQKYLKMFVVFFALSLLIYRKPWLLLIPGFLFLTDWILLTKNLKFVKEKLWAYGWALFFGAIYFFTLVKGQISAREVSLQVDYYQDPELTTPYINRVMYTIFMTAKLLILPLKLTIYHEGESVSSVQSFTLVSMIFTIFVIGLIFYFTFKIEKYRIWLYILLMIYGSLALSYYPTVLVWSMADRYLYFGSIFFCLGLAILLEKIQKHKEIFYILLISITLFYSIKTISRNNDWRTNKNLWLATQKVSPYSYRVYNNLGDVYAAENDYDTAIKYFQTSLQIYPKFADAAHNLGYTYYQKGDKELAKQYLAISLQMNPRLYQAAYKLGVIAYEQGDLPTAKAFMQKAYEINPTYAPTVDALNKLK